MEETTTNTPTRIMTTYKGIPKGDLRRVFANLLEGDTLQVQLVTDSGPTTWLVSEPPKCGRGKFGSWSVCLRDPNGGSVMILGMKDFLGIREVRAERLDVTLRGEDPRPIQRGRRRAVAAPPAA